jgi:hypothetical protein
MPAMKRFVIPAVAIAAPLVSSAQGGIQDLPISGEVGIFRPVSSGLRNALGSNWFSFGVGPARIYSKDGMRADTDFQVVSHQKNGNRILMLIPSIGMVKVFGKPEDMAKPFVAVRAGAAYLDYGITTGGTRHTTRRGGFTSNAELGITIGDRLTLSARYDWLPRFDGLQFDGVSFSLSYVLFKL